MNRIASASVQELLQRIEPAIAAGSVNIISVQAIRERSGERWQRKREQVEAFIERTFRRISASGDLIVALNDCEFLTVQSGVSRVQAISLCTNILREALVFFLGAAEPEDLRLLLVTGFQDGEITVQGITLEQAEREGAETEAAALVSDRTTPPSQSLAARMRRSVQLTVGATRCEVSTRAEPVWNTAAGAIASFAMHCEVSLVLADGERRALSLMDLSPGVAAEAALQTLDHALDLLTIHPTIRMGLHTPLPLAALTNSTSRFRLLHSLKAWDEAVHRYLIVEITDLDEGAPQGRLLEIVAVLKPYCRAVLARSPSLAADPRRWRRTGLSGITVDCQHMEPAARDAADRLAQFATRAQEVGPGCVGYGLSCRSLIVAAWSAGFTHLSGPIISEHAEVEQGAVRLSPVELYRQTEDEVDLSSSGTSA